MCWVRRLVLCALIVAVLFGSTPSGQSPVPPRSPANPGTPQRPARDNPIRAQAPPAAVGGIRGRVSAAGSGQPLVKARVSFSSDTGAVADPIFTDANGVFAFPDLPAGHYTFSAEKAGYARARYGSKGPIDPPMEIAVVGGRVVQGLDVALTKGAAIVGRITDELGDPIVGGVVSLGAVQSVGSEMRLVSVAHGTAETNDLGEYRIGDLPAGRYFVSVAGAGLGTMPSGMPREWERLKAWGPTFFPGSGSLANATPIALSAGEERRSVDFVVVPQRPAQRLTRHGRRVSGGWHRRTGATAVTAAEGWPAELDYVRPSGPDTGRPLFPPTQRQTRVWHASAWRPCPVASDPETGSPSRTRARPARSSTSRSRLATLTCRSTLRWHLCRVSRAV